MFKVIKLSVILLMIALFVQGCTPKVNLSPAVKSKIKTIKVDENVSISPIPFFMTKGDAIFAGLFGPAGSVMANSDMSKEEQLKKYLDDNSISMKDIYLKSLKTNLKNNAFFANKIVSKNADYFLKSQINMYGLVYHHSIFNSDYKPTISVQLQLFDKNNEVVWKEVDFITSYNGNTPQKELSVFFKDPELMKESLSIVTDEVLKSILGRLPE